MSWIPQKYSSYLDLSPEALFLFWHCYKQTITRPQKPAGINISEWEQHQAHWIFYCCHPELKWDDTATGSAIAISCNKANWNMIIFHKMFSIQTVEEMGTKIHFFQVSRALLLPGLNHSSSLLSQPQWLVHKIPVQFLRQSQSLQWWCSV